jgi:hypothetical protein
MTFILRTDYGCTEVVLADNCGFDTFYKVADLLSDRFKIHFTNKIDDSETSYWDFSYRGHKLTLHFNIYNGISIFPRRCKDAVAKDNDAVKELADKLGDLR